MLRRDSCRLLMVGLLSVVVYVLAFTWPYPLAPIARRGGVPDIGVLSNYRWQAAVAYVVAIAAVFVLYGVALRVAGRMGSGGNIAWGVVGVGVAAAVALIATYPFGASDVFLYVAHGRVLGVHGYNPFVVPPSALPMEAYVPFSSEWMPEVSPYGPLWEWLAALLARLGDGTLLRSLLAFKGAAFASYLGCTALVAAILRRREPERLAWGLVGFAWNPLVLIETHANAHNDLVMMLFVLLAVWLWESGRYLGVLPALTLGALVKYVPLLLVPMAALLMGNRLARREWLRTLLASGLISLGLALVIFKPLWPGLERWSVWGQMQRVHFSTGAWLILLLRQVSAGAMAFRVAVWTMRLIFAAAYGVMLVWAVARPRSLAAAFHDLLYLWVVAGSMGFGYWYVAWLVPLAALGTGSVDLRRAATFSATGLLSVAVYTFLGTMWRERVGIDTLTLITVPLVFVTPFIVAGTRRREPSEVDRRRHREHAMEWFGPYPTALLYPWSAQVSHPVVGVPVLPFDDGASTEPGGAAGLQGPREPPTHAQGGQDGQVSGDC